jgi:hypothetical protein
MAFSNSRATPKGLAAALRNLRAKARKPTEADRPPPSVFQGRAPVRFIEGQLSLEDEGGRGEAA